MKRQLLNSGGYRYLIELYDGLHDLKTDRSSSNYVVLRKYDLINNIVVDNAFYFIERKLYDSYINDIIESYELDGKRNKKTSDLLCFPCFDDSNSMSFSLLADDWNEAFNDDSLYSDFNINYTPDAKGKYLKVINDDNSESVYKLKEYDRYDKVSKEGQEDTYRRNNEGEYLRIEYKDENDAPAFKYVKIESKNKCNLKVDFELGKDVYELLNIDKVKDDNNEITGEIVATPANIINDKIRIYHPDIKKITNAIIYITTYINSIKYTFICRTYDQFPSNSYEDLVVDYTHYSEYITVEVPNLESLFSDDVYYIEDMNFVCSDKNKEFMNEVTADPYIIKYDGDDVTYNNKNNEYDYHNYTNQYVKFKLFLQPYKIDEITYYDDYAEEDVYENVKVFLKENIDAKKLKKHPLTIVLYPITDNIDESSYHIEPDSFYDISSTSFISSSHFSLKAKFGFENDHLSVISEFDYPKELYISDTSVYDAYIDYYNIDVTHDYTFNVNEGYYNEKKRIEDLYNDNYKLTDTDLKILATTLSDPKYNKIKDVSHYADKVKLLRNLRISALNEEYKQEFGFNASFIGYQLKLFSDVQCTRCIYSSEISLEDAYKASGHEIDILEEPDIVEMLKNGLQDFSFPLTGIFSSWSQLPDYLVCYTSFVDRFLGITLVTNPLVITKEYFKYMINNNEDHLFRLHWLSDYNNTKIKDMKIVEINNDSAINFINNINCSVVTNPDGTNEKITVTRNSGPRVIYKPIFYKVQPLQNISIRANVNQNIGINLSQYMTKVETFKLFINGNEIYESSRNDGYVIFNISPTVFNSSSGTYDILTQDDEYISSGNYAII